MTMNEALRIRPLVPGADDAAYLNVINTVARESPDRTSTAQDELEAERKMPSHDPHGQLIAELDGQPVGIGFGRLNPLDVIDRIGWFSASVLPEFRRRHIGTALAEAALQGLRTRGATKLRAGTREENLAGNAFLRSLGFQACRTESYMRRPLETLPSRVGENTEIDIRETTLDDDDLRLTVDLINETFKEDWDRMPVTVEGRRARATEFARQGGILRTVVATLRGQTVGLVQAFISPRDNAELKVQRGALMALGVLKPFRRQGIAAALMLWGLQFLKASGMSEAELYVDNSNPTQALDIYLKLGFQVVRKFLDYEQPA
jgi:ribosomal protein S18 acetylase RimI-like enzyme